MPSRENPFSAIEEAVQRQADEEASLKAITGARVRLILGNDGRSAFFATLALRLRIEIDWKCATMAVDGRTLFVNPTFVKGLTPDEVLGCLAHEVLHLVLLHHTRRENRDPSRFNIAADLATNQILIQAGFTLPKCRLMVGEGRYRDFPTDKSAEEYYALLGEPPAKQGNQNGSENGGGASPDPGGCGEVRDAGDPSEAAQQEAEWKAAVSQAEQISKTRGALPGGLARLVNAVIHPPANWRDILREFLRSNAKNDYSWGRPNRRFVSQGLYLPGLHSEELGDVVLVVDCSGSIGQEELDTFASEAEAILGTYECRATILYHDTEVTHVEEWTSSDGPLKLNPVGGGGTSHVAVFEWLAESGLNPSCVIALTDMESVFPTSFPDMTVLWGVIGGNQSQPPFGRVVHIKD